MSFFYLEHKKKDKHTSGGLSFLCLFVDIHPGHIRFAVTLDHA